MVPVLWYDSFQGRDSLANCDGDAGEGDTGELSSQPMRRPSAARLPRERR
jgi:hypothetical protein